MWIIVTFFFCFKLLETIALAGACCHKKYFYFVTDSILLHFPPFIVFISFSSSDNLLSDNIEDSRNTQPIIAFTVVRDVLTVLQCHGYPSYLRTKRNEMILNKTQHGKHLFIKLGMARVSADYLSFYCFFIHKQSAIQSRALHELKNSEPRGLKDLKSHFKFSFWLTSY